MNELLRNIESEIEELKRSEYLLLTQGWTESRHYAEGYVAGQLATLMNLRAAIQAENRL